MHTCTFCIDVMKTFEAITPVYNTLELMHCFIITAIFNGCENDTEKMYINGKKQFFL